MKYEREKKELLAYFYCDQFGGTMAIKKNNISHLYHPYQLSSKILAPKPLERIKDL